MEPIKTTKIKTLIVGTADIEAAAVETTRIQNLLVTKAQIEEGGNDARNDQTQP